MFQQVVWSPRVSISRWLLDSKNLKILFLPMEYKKIYIYECNPQDIYIYFWLLIIYCKFDYFNKVPISNLMFQICVDHLFFFIFSFKN